MKDNNKRLKIVRRGGGLIETNSSSSHAVSICMDAKTNLKPGDPDFDLDIKDGVLFIPKREEGEFGWQWEKSNSCLTKLQYVCGFFFNQYQKPEVQKSQKKLEKILKKIFGVNKVVFEWVEEYVKNPKAEYFNCPDINHNSYSEMKIEILENEDTIRNFILNPKSWWYGGNDNSDAPSGFYSETKITEDTKVIVDPETILTVDFGEELGKIDFPLVYPSEEGLLESVKFTEGNEFIDNISWSTIKGKFVLNNTEQISASNRLNLYEDIIIDNKLYLAFYGDSVINTFLKEQKINPFMSDAERIKNIISTASDKVVEGKDYVFAPARLWTKEFGVLFDF
jgi:hypothetical protein